MNATLPPATRRWTPQQDAIFEAIRGGTDNVLAEAVAGAGKTSTAVEAATLAPEASVGFVAFNKHIADELRTRLAGAARACTLHSLGRAALLKAWPASELDDLKLVRLLAKGPDGDKMTWYRKGQPCLTPRGRAVAELAAAAKVTLTPLHVAQADGTEAPNVQGLDDLADLMGIDLPGKYTARDFIGDVAALLEAARDDVRRFDFDDMLWLPVVHGLPVPRHDLLFVDEMQDLSALQRTLAGMAAGDGRVVAIGDSRQSVNLFTGADPRAVGHLADWLARAEAARARLDLPLTVTFRCPESHVALARQVVPHIEAAAGAAAGLVRVIDEAELLGLIEPGDLVLARRNAPLVQLTLKLLAAGRPARMLGRDIGRGLLQVIDAVPNGTMPELVVGVEDWKLANVDRLERKGAAEAQIQAVQDRAACLKELASRFRTVNELVTFIRDKLGCDDKADRAQMVSLASVHRAKGLEAGRVFVIDTDNLPMILPCRSCKGTGRYASAACVKCRGRGCRQHPAQIEQEWNLLYVALTRSKSEMYFLDAPPSGLSW